MKKYCSNCGSPNEYNVSEPKKCIKCGTSFSKASESFIQRKKQEINSNLETPDYFDDKNLEIEEVEPMTEQEIEKVFLSQAAKPLTIRDLAKEGIKRQKVTQKTTKRQKKKK